MRNVGKDGRIRHSTEDNTMRGGKKRFTCRITKPRMQTHTNNISHLLLHDRLMPPDLVNCFTATLTKKEKMRNDLYVIKMCLAKLYSEKEHERKNFLCFNAASENVREDL